jgi:hypothetical protein
LPEQRIPADRSRWLARGRGRNRRSLGRLLDRHRLGQSFRNLLRRNRIRGSLGRFLDRDGLRLSLSRCLNGNLWRRVGLDRGRVLRRLGNFSRAATRALLAVSLALLVRTFARGL